MKTYGGSAKLILRIRFWGLVLATMIAATGASGCRAQQNIAVTNPWIEAAVRDVGGKSVSVLEMAAPQNDQRNIELTQAHLEQLAGCGQLIRFDYQSAIDAQAARSMAKGARINEIHPNEGLSIPSTYEDCCRQAAEHLCAMGQIRRWTANRRLKAINARLSALSEEMLKAIATAGIADAPVICSMEQEAFARWMGLDVVATYISEGENPADSLKKAIETTKGRKVRFIIVEARHYPGVQEAAGLLPDKPMVILRSQPDMTLEKKTFDAMLRANVAAMTAAAVPAGPATK
ncbi:MAG TPA: zinc ABC transporter substrate-binding protein [Candidatus Brocadiia bacterium]|nr:zinc ABC transporter substrate-binding protein [Candidatus Brocadiia bacterium]